MAQVEHGIYFLRCGGRTATLWGHMSALSSSQNHDAIIWDLQSLYDLPKGKCLRWSTWFSKSEVRTIRGISFIHCGWQTHSNAKGVLQSGIGTLGSGQSWAMVGNLGLKITKWEGVPPTHEPAIEGYNYDAGERLRSITQPMLDTPGLASAKS